VGNVLVLWDVDHTLIDAGGGSTFLYGVVFRELFGRDLPGVAPMAGRTDRAIVRDTMERAGIGDPSQHVEAFLAGLAAHAPGLSAVVAQRGRVLPGAAAAVAAVADRAPVPAVQSVLTGNIRPLAEAKLGALGLTRHLDFDIGAYGDHDENRAELVHLARRHAARAYGQDFAGPATVLVGDTPLDSAAAKATGARSVGVASGASSAADLAAAGADAVLADLTDTAAVLAAILGGRLTRR
jgi:phosphoglycolate phosphatase-like HAD superfamily hydrolase